MTEVSRAVHYRSASYTVPLAGATLQDLIEEALRRNRLAEERERPLAHGEYQVLNSNAKVGTSICGVVHEWVKGQHQLAVDRVPGQTVWRVEEVAAGKTQDGRPREFLPNTLYFAVYQDHLVALQSQGMKIPQLADYLTWFLRDRCAGLVPETQQIRFDFASAKALRDRGIGAAKAIRLRKPLADKAVMQPQPGGRRRKPWVEKVLNEQRASAVTMILNAVGLNVPDEVLNDIEARHLELYLELRRPHGRDELGNTAMNAIGRLVAQEATDEFAVVLQNGAELSGKDLKLSKDVTLVIQDGSTHPSAFDVFRQLDEYLRYLVAQNLV